MALRRCLTIDGQELTPKLLSSMLGKSIASIDILQTHAEIDGTDKSGRHSNLTRIEVAEEGSDARTRLIVKRVACPELSERPNVKWQRDIQVRASAYQY